MIRKIQEFYYNVKNGIKNLIRWTPIIWGDMDYDWAYAARILEAKLRFMAKDTENWHVMNAERDKKEMLICAEALKRITEDRYLFDSMPLGHDVLVEDSHKNWKYFYHPEQLIQQDIEILAKNIKKFRGWWD